MARYVPKDNLVIDFDGLDAHAEARKKTAACKILDDTTTGARLEDLSVRLVGKVPGAGDSGAETPAMFEHVARSGFVVAAGRDTRKEEPNYVVALRLTELMTFASLPDPAKSSSMAGMLKSASGMGGMSPGGMPPGAALPSSPAPNESAMPTAPGPPGKMKPPTPG